MEGIFSAAVEYQLGINIKFSYYKLPATRMAGCKTVTSSVRDAMINDSWKNNLELVYLLISVDVDVPGSC